VVLLGPWETSPSWLRIACYSTGERGIHDFDDFDHPLLGDGHPLLRHLLYRKGNR
jgi:hypothetical protein